MKYCDKAGFTLSGNWYKGNLHSHTINSDGHLTPQESVNLFKQHGYHFLCFSDHDIYTDYSAQFDSEDFCMLPGLEASAILMDAEGKNRLKVHHIHGILGTKKMQMEAAAPLFQHKERLTPPVFYGTWEGAMVAQRLCDSLRARGCFTTYNHPIWSRVEQEEFIHTKGIDGLEIFNYNTVNESGTGYDVTYWDVMLRKGIYMNAVATDDNHNEGLFDDACGGWIMVNAEKLDHDTIVQAFLDGNYYSSAGPEIYDWGVKNDTVYVKCSDVSRINFVAGNCVNAGITVMGNEPDESITQAEFKLKGNESYVRAECIDAAGKTAWTNPIFLKKAE